MEKMDIADLVPTAQGCRLDGQSGTCSGRSGLSLEGLGFSKQVMIRIWCRTLVQGNVLAILGIFFFFFFCSIILAFSLEDYGNSWENTSDDLEKTNRIWQ